VILGVGRHFYVEVITGFLADKFYQLIGVFEVVCTRAFIRDVASQCYQAGDAPADLVVE
jgi:hypothetical protein